jgi:hypothetical protein
MVRLYRPWRSWAWYRNVEMLHDLQAKLGVGSINVFALSADPVHVFW